MSDEPVRLTLVREGAMIAIDLATADPIVPRSLMPLSEDLLRDIDEELSSWTKIFMHIIILS